MKKYFLPFLAVAMCLLCKPALCQDEDSTALLGLPGDNLDLYAVLDLFQKSKTIEAFEKSLNDEKTKINNLDLNLDKKIDFIKVATKKADNSYQFILQVDVSEKETQDVAVILLDKNKDGKISLQMVGDEELYGKDYVIEPKGNSSVTANPAYTGDNPVTVNVPASTTTVQVVQSAPIVQYVYSPAYVPYAPPYHYGFYPPWFGFATVMAVGIYRSNNYYHHHGYHGGHYGGGNTVVINNNNNFNNYNSNRNKSTTVSNNMAKGNYGNRTSNRAGNGPSASTRPASGASNRPSGGGPSASTRQATGGPSASTRPSGGASASPRPSTSNSSSMGGSGRTRSGGGGGGMRGGGGGGRRR